MAKERFQPKLHVKRGDQVMIIAGDCKGQTGEITQVIKEKNRAIVAGQNLVKRHLKPRMQGQQGEIVEKEASIHLSNIMLLDPKTGQPTRIRRQEVGGKKVRVSVKSNEVIK
jgi:large subunit ribosomal protein L24